MIELKPCPFCGSVPYLKKTKHKEFRWAVKCSNINCGCKTERWNGPEGAIKSWNRRKDD